MYNIKTSSIVEAKDAATLQFSELVSILITFEMNLKEQKVGHKSRNVSFKTSQTSSSIFFESPNFIKSMSEIGDDLELFDEGSPSLAILTKKFNSLIKPMIKGKEGTKPRRLFNFPIYASSVSPNSSKSDEHFGYKPKDIDTDPEDVLALVI